MLADLTTSFVCDELGNAEKEVEMPKRSGEEFEDTDGLLADFDPKELRYFKHHPLEDLGKAELPESVDEMGYESIELTRSPSVATFCSSSQSICFSERSITMSPIGLGSICVEDSLDLAPTFQCESSAVGDASDCELSSATLSENPDLSSLT